MALVGGLLNLPSAAFAAPGHPGEPLSTVPSLRPGPEFSFGPISIPSVTTVDNDLSGLDPAWGCGTAEGAAAYQLEPDERARLVLNVTELDADGLCAIGVYRSGVASVYDVSGRAPFVHLERTCSGNCAITTRLDPGTYFVVIWPRGNGSVSREVGIDGSVRGFSTIDSSLTGVTLANGCKRIDRGQRTTLSYDVEPRPLTTEEVLVSRIDRRTGEETSFGPQPLNGEGAGSLVISGLLRGYHDIVVRHEGTAERMPARVVRCLIVRGPTKLDIRPRGERYTYDDYFVWSDGDRMVFRLPVLPWPPAASGELSIRIERNIGNHRYKDWVVHKHIPVTDGLALLRLRANYRSNGLPFYRMRTEWRGSNTHAPAKSDWICFQIDP